MCTCTYSVYKRSCCNCIFGESGGYLVLYDAVLRSLTAVWGLLCTLVGLSVMLAYMLRDNIRHARNCPSSSDDEWETTVLRIPE